MKKVIVFKEMLEDLERNPRDVTFFGEEKHLPIGNYDFDLYYFSAEGIRTAENLREKYSPVPIFLWDGSEKTLMRRISDYTKKNNNHLAGTCGEDIFCFYPVQRTEEGVKVHPSFDYYSEYKPTFLENIAKNKGWEDFPDEIARKIKDLSESLK